MQKNMQSIVRFAVYIYVLCQPTDGTSLLLEKNWRYALTVVTRPKCSCIITMKPEPQINGLDIFYIHNRITAYLKLVVLSVGFQHLVKTGTSPQGTAIMSQSIDSAKDVIQITIERLYPTQHLRYAMEANFLYVSFAAAFLVNVSAKTRAENKLIHLKT